MKLPEGTKVARYVLDGHGWIGQKDTEDDPSRVIAVEDPKVLQDRSGGWADRLHGDNWILFAGEELEEQAEMVGKLSVHSPTHLSLEGHVRLTMDYMDEERYATFRLERWEVSLP